MPFDTFFNLPEEKQKRIIDSAIEEFAEKGYLEGSVDRITKKAGISKGSIYQYFKDKKELFIYLVERAINLKINFMLEKIERLQNPSFYETFEELLLAGCKFAKENPKSLKLAEKLEQFYKNNSQQSKELLDELNKMINTKVLNTWNMFLYNLVKTDMDKGEIRNDIDIKTIFFLVNKTSQIFGEYVFHRLLYLDDENVKKLVKDTINIIKNGIKPISH